MGNKVMMSSEDAFRLIVKSIDMGKYDNALEILNDIGEQIREAEKRIQEAEEQLREAEVVVREYGNLMLDLYEDSCSTEEIQERITQLADRTTTFLTPATYTPKTEMGKKMMALREKAIAGGMTLLDEEEITGEGMVLVRREDFMRLLKDHYWDSLSDNKELIIKHFMDGIWPYLAALDSKEKP